MKVHSKALLVASLTMTMAACSSAPSGPPIGDPLPNGAKVETPVTQPPVGQTEVPSQSGDAQQFFVTRVFPVLSDATNNERCSTCHAVGALGAPAFLAGSAQNAYKVIREYNGGSLIAVPERNLLLLKSQHEGPQLNGEQRGAVTEWLQKEYPGRSTPPEELSLFEAFERFGLCMNRNEFIGQAVNDIVQTPVEGATCDLCHNLAQAPVNGGNFVLDPDPNITFDNMKLFPGITKLVAPTVSNTGVFQGLRESRRIESRGTEFNLQGSTNCAAGADEVALVAGGGVLNVFDPLYCHPNYNVDGDLEDQLSQFVNNTRFRSDQQICNDDNNPQN